MTSLPARFLSTAIPAKFDRAYNVHDFEEEHEVNVAQLCCSCRDFTTARAGFPADDRRRVCKHLSDRLSSTKLERSFDPLVQLLSATGAACWT